MYDSHTKKNSHKTQETERIGENKKTKQRKSMRKNLIRGKHQLTNKLTDASQKYFGMTIQVHF